MTEREFQDMASKQLHGPHPFSREAMHVHGISRRDWFAGHALAGLLANQRADLAWVSKHSVQSAFNIADAMLAEGAKGGDA